MPIRIAAAIADDELGAAIRSRLLAKGMPHIGLQTSDMAGTSYSIVLQSDKADRTFLHYPGANAFFNPSVVDVTEASIVHFGYPSLVASMVEDSGEPIRALFERAHLADATTSIDLAVVDPSSSVAALDWAQIFTHVLPQVDVASPSLDDLTSALGIAEPFSVELVERLAQSFIDQGVGIVALSAGANGVYLKTAGAERLGKGGTILAGLAAQWVDVALWQPPLPVESWSSSNGAGDSLTAGLLFSLWSGFEPGVAIKTAAASAALRMMGAPVSRDALTSMLSSSSRITANSLQGGD